MTKSEELIQAAKIMKNHCDSFGKTWDDCGKCIFKGAEKIVRYASKSVCVLGRNEMSGEWEEVANLPINSFASLKEGEDISIDEILKGADQ